MARLRFAIPIFFDPRLDAAVRRYLKAPEEEEEAAARKVDARGDGASFDLLPVRRYLVCYPSLAEERVPLREKALLASEPFNPPSSPPVLGSVVGTLVEWASYVDRDAQVAEMHSAARCV